MTTQLSALHTLTNPFCPALFIRRSALTHHTMNAVSLGYIPGYIPI